jgi:hypothetical protein
MNSMIALEAYHINRQVTFNSLLVIKDMGMQKSDIIWLISIISLSLGGTFVIIYVIRHLTDYFERRKYR